ncbi:hypothetical protein EZV62_012457 [Acer yangbiense]|uniref:RNA helicase n=1 Tax=Acer yangbiense TaxID=1000413 RepID=A0A5C7HWB4_9ROSI|nr:hypothetical protein EZV62_012457 [Acer yangbiense]
MFQTKSPVSSPPFPRCRSTLGRRRYSPLFESNSSSLSPRCSPSDCSSAAVRPASRVLTGWKPPLPIRRMSKKACDLIRKQWHIIVVGEDIPPPIKNFKDMRFLEPILKMLKAKGNVQPTPIQVQGLPVILSGRDMIGIVFTGSGKTLVFVLPMIMIALQEEMMMPIIPGEGPFCLIICPSRELARQIYEVIEQFLIPMREAGYPELRALLCIGGVDMRSQLEVVRKGVHCTHRCCNSWEVEGHAQLSHFYRK